MSYSIAERVQMSQHLQQSFQRQKDRCENHITHSDNDSVINEDHAVDAFSDHVSLIHDADARDLYGAGGQASKEILLRSLKQFLFILHNSWNNILGPQVHRVWKNRERLDSAEEHFLVSYVNKHVMIGDVASDKSKHTRKMIALPGQKIIIYARIFPKSTPNLGMTGNTITTNSLSFVLPFKTNDKPNYDKYLSLLSFLDRSSQIIVNTIIDKPELEEICDMLCEFDAAMNDIINNRTSVNIPCLVVPYTHGLSRLLKTAFQGFLQCGGYGAVFGGREDETTMRYVFHLLTSILPPRDRVCTLGPSRERCYSSLNGLTYLQCVTLAPGQTITEADRKPILSTALSFAVIDVRGDGSVKYLQNRDGVVRTVDEYSGFVDRLVEDLLKVQHREGFVDRLGQLAFEQIKCNAELIVSAHSENVNIASCMGWKDNESDIFISWANRLNLTNRRYVLFRGLTG